VIEPTARSARASQDLRLDAPAEGADPEVAVRAAAGDALERIRS
jgi:hypothetical protein